MPVGSSCEGPTERYNTDSNSVYSESQGERGKKEGCHYSDVFDLKWPKVCHSVFHILLEDWADRWRLTDEDEYGFPVPSHNNWLLPDKSLNKTNSGSGHFMNDSCFSFPSSVAFTGRVLLTITWCNVCCQWGHHSTVRFFVSAFWSYSEVCICASSVHLGGISHRCMHSSCSETSSPRVIYYPNSPVITVVYTDHPPLLLQRPSPPKCPPHLPPLFGLQPEQSSSSLARSRSQSWLQSGLLLSSGPWSFSFYNLCFSTCLSLSAFGSKNSNTCLCISTMEQWKRRATISAIIPYYPEDIFNMIDWHICSQHIRESETEIRN